VPGWRDLVPPEVLGPGSLPPESVVALPPPARSTMERLPLVLVARWPQATADAALAVRVVSPQGLAWAS